METNFRHQGLSQFFDRLLYHYSKTQSEFISEQMKAVIESIIHPAYQEKYSWIFDSSEGLCVLEDETIEIMEEHARLVERGSSILYWDQILTFEGKEYLYHGYMAPVRGEEDKLRPCGPGVAVCRNEGDVEFNSSLRIGDFNADFQLHGRGFKHLF